MEDLNNRRRSLRLSGYDYSSPGAYFVTICTQNRKCLFGEIFNGKMVLNESGEIVKGAWLKTVEIRANVKLDEFVIMPNHFHAIIFIESTNCRGVMHYAPTRRFKSPANNLGAIVRGFKSAVTVQINKLCGARGLPVWQRNYYEHVIRNEKSLNAIRQYIISNPATWDTDEENPKRIK